MMQNAVHAFVGCYCSVILVWIEVSVPPLQTHLKCFIRAATINFDQRHSETVSPFVSGTCFDRQLPGALLVTLTSP